MLFDFIVISWGKYMCVKFLPLLSKNMVAFFIKREINLFKNKKMKRK